MKKINRKYKFMSFIALAALIAPVVMTVNPPKTLAESETVSPINDSTNDSTIINESSDSSTLTNNNENIDSQSRISALAVNDRDTPYTINGTDYYPVDTLANFKYQVNLNRKIVLMNDLTIDSGIKVFDGFEVYGTDPVSNTTHTITFSGNGMQSTLYTTDTSKDINTTFRYVNIIGGNYYGIVTYYDTVTGEQLYDNVTYTSSNSQPFYSLSGVVHLKNSTFTQTAGGGLAQEFMEGTQLILEGNVTINHDSYGTSINSLAFIWSRGSKNKYIKVLDGSNVTLNTSKTLMYSGSTSLPFNLTIGDNATLNLGIGGNYYYPNSTGSGSNITIGENSTLNVSDLSKTYSRTGLKPGLIDLYNSDTINFSKGSNLIMNTDNRNYLINQGSSSSTSVFNLINGIGSVDLTNTKKNGGFFSLNSNSKVLLNNSGNKIIFNDNNILLNDYSSIQLNSSNVTFPTPSNNDLVNSNFASLYNSSSHVVWKPTLVSDYNLVVNDSYISNPVVSGTTVVGTTVWITYTNISGETVTESMKTTDTNYSFDLTGKVNVFAQVTVNTAVGGSQYPPVATQTITIQDDIPPTADTVFNKININDLSSYDYTTSLANIADNSNESVTTTVVTPFASEIGLQTATLLLTDNYGNSTTKTVKAFIYNDDSYVNLTDTKYMVSPYKFTINDYEVTDVNEYLNNLDYSIWNENGLVDKTNSVLTKTNLETIPSSGVYYANYTNGSISYSLEITVVSSIDAIDLEVPVTMMFGTSDSYDGSIISPQYNFKNKGVNDVTITLNPVTTLSDDDIRLSGDSKNLDLILNINSLALPINDVNSNEFSLTSNSTSIATFSGTYSGDFTQTKTPKYKMTFTIK